MVITFRLKILVFFLVLEILASSIFFILSQTRFETVETGSFVPELIDWQEVSLPAVWSPRDSHTLVEYDNKLWLMGGLNGNSFVIDEGIVEYWKAPHFNDVWSSDDGVNWDLITEDAPWGKRRSTTAIAFLDRIWLMGGWGPKIGLRNDIWYSQDGLNWTQAAAHAAWPAREGHQLVVFKNKLWLMGGVNYDKQEVKNDVWYSDDGVNWSQAVKVAPWSGRWDHAVTVFQDKLWLIGGMDLNDGVFSDVWTSEDGINWNLVTDKPLWQSRQGHEILAFQDKLWLVGRFNDKENGGENDIWFSKDGLQWKRTNSNPAWLGREDSAATVFNGQIWLLGGMDKNWTWRNDIWHTVNEKIR